MFRTKRSLMTIGALICISLAIGIFLGVQEVNADSEIQLQILLTNDDGWNSPAIQTMKDALESAGHTVWLVAPESNRSGSGAALSVEPVRVTPMGQNEFAVNGTPATCVLIGLAMMETKPDLVISGPNIRFSGGSPSIHSGTIGAGLTGLSQGITSFILASDPPVSDMTDPLFLAHFENVAEFTTELIETLIAANGSIGLLPSGVGIKIGYPPLPEDEITGISLVEQGNFAVFTLSYQEIDTNLYVPQFIPSNPQDAEPEGEVAMYMNGYITILPFDNDITADHYDTQDLKKLLKDLIP